MSKAVVDFNRKQIRHGDGGYALLALIAAMTVLLILATGYVPDLKRRLKREREEELLFRGQEVVDAIGRFWQLTQRYPTSLEQLTDGISIGGTRRIRFMRASALTDPMSNEDWKLVRFGDPVVREFIQAYLESIGQPQNPQLRQFIESGRLNLPRTPTSRTPTRNQPPGSTTQRQATGVPSATTAPSGAQPFGFPGDAQQGEGEGTGPLLGVISKSEETTVRAYYELERYDEWPFVYIPPQFLPQAQGEARVRALMNPILFPSDPLARMGFGSLPVSSPRPLRPGGVLPGGQRQPQTRQPQPQRR